MTLVHIDHHAMTLNGVTFRCTHSGQKRAYGDTFHEYDVNSELPAEEVEKFCAEHVYKAIPKSEWLVDFRKPGCSMEEAFRPHYTFKPNGRDGYFYVVRLLYTD